MWKQIPSYPDYEITKDGRVRRIKNQRELKASPLPSGYIRVNLRKEGKTYTAYIHKLVAETYLPTAAVNVEVNHKDGKKNNNDLSNLEWTTHQENVQHSYDELNREGKQIIEVEFLDGQKLQFPSIKECAAAFGVDPTTIRDYIDHKLTSARKIQAHFRRI